MIPVIATAIGKRIEYHLETPTSDRTQAFVADARRGRHENEIHLTPHGDAPPEAPARPLGYYKIGEIYVRNVLPLAEGEDISNLPDDQAAALLDAPPPAP